VNSVPLIKQVMLLEYEIDPPVELIESGGKVVAGIGCLQLPTKGRTYSMRSKSMRMTYYISPNPACFPLVVDARVQLKCASQLPELPRTRRAGWFAEYGFNRRGRTRSC